MSPLGRPDIAATQVTRVRRVDEALDVRATGPRLRALFPAAGRGGCDLLVATYEPGHRCTGLHRAGDLLVRGDLLRDRSEAGGPHRPVVDPGIRLHRFPNDPDLPGRVVSRGSSPLTRAPVDAGQPRRDRLGDAR